MHAGVARANITPPVGLELSGWAFGSSAGVLDELFAKVLVLESNSEKVAVVTADLIAFQTEYADAIREGIADKLDMNAKNVLVTGRHVNGGLGTYAWCGDLHEEAGKYQIGGPRCNYTANLTYETLVIDNGPENKAVAFMSISRLMGGRGPMILYIAPKRVTFMRESVEFSKPLDMTRYRRIRIHHRRGLCQVHIDGQLVFRTRVHREEASASDFHGGNIARRTQFGQFGDEGQSFWKRIHYSLHNPTLDDFEWIWEAADGERPDEYQRQRMIQIHANHPDQKPNPDHGYSSWLMLEDECIFLVDYTNYGDEPGKSHLVGVYLDPEDIA